MEDRKNEFLILFRELEEEMVKLSRLRDNYVSFNRALSQVHYKRYDPIVSSEDVFEFLKSASDLRNILSHRNDVAEPTENFLNKFRKITKNIIFPTRLIDIATKGNKLVIGYDTDKILYLSRLMSSHYLSHIPIYDLDGNFLGVFSRSSLFQHLVSNHGINFNENSLVSEMLDVINIYNHDSESYLFADDDTHVIDIYEKMTKTTKEERRLAAIFLTKNGKENEPLIGIVTQTDILKMIVDIDK